MQQIFEDIWTFMNIYLPTVSKSASNLRFSDIDI